MTNNLVFINVLLLFISSTCARNVWHASLESNQKNGGFNTAVPSVNLPDKIDSPRTGKQQGTLGFKSFFRAPKICGSDERVGLDGNCQQIIDF